MVVADNLPVVAAVVVPAAAFILAGIGAIELRTAYQISIGFSIVALILLGLYQGRKSGMSWPKSAVSGAVAGGIGVLMIIYVVFGGMLATTWVQITKAILLLAGSVMLSILVMAQFGYSFGSFFEAVSHVTWIDPKTGQTSLALWLRRLQGSGDVLYSGSYSVCFLPAIDAHQIVALDAADYAILRKSPSKINTYRGLVVILVIMDKESKDTPSAN